MLLLLLLSQLIEKHGSPPQEGSSYADRLLWAMKVSELSQTKLAEIVGVTPQSIQHLCDPLKNARGSKHTVAIAEATGVRAEWLARGRGDPVDPKRNAHLTLHEPTRPYTAAIGTRRIPLLNYVQAGSVTEVVPDFLVDEYLLTDLDLSERAFALEIKGESMRAPPGSAGESFAPGDHIIIDCSVTPLPGDFVVAKNGNFNENGEHGATFKKYRPRGIDEQSREIFELTPLNRDFPTLYSDRQPLAIIGTMMEHRIYRKKR